ncbi:MAG: cob(I)yrinic acid a,c-diamide adenosyltransferase [Micromonosporaceae bacterium]|nr:cob(I)yrinic acid a,c-diamide adenosyltransferase [Micromonosporaceae bacterium]
MAGVHLTRIYTRTGDDGTTAIGDGSRVAKTDPRIIATADVDECNAAIGVALALGGLADDVRAVLTAVQNDLFDLGADFCNPVLPERAGTAGGMAPLRITEGYTLRVERWCDEFNARLPKLRSFILPGGTPGAALLHQARTIARRAERSAWMLARAEAERTNPQALAYLNRLSDLLFILCRIANPAGDVPWVPGSQPTIP